METAHVQVAPLAGAAAPALLIDATEAARLCGLSRTTWHMLVGAGKAPAQVHLPIRAARWNRSEIEGWVAAGCPDRKAWELMRQS
jgi:predicted DNA-binding transcriptional regulator AlpA